MTSFLGLQPAYSLSVTENYQDVSHQHVRLQPSAPRCPQCSPLAISSRRAAGCWQCLAVVDEAGTHLASACRTSLGTCLVESVESIHCYPCLRKLCLHVTCKSVALALIVPMNNSSIKNKRCFLYFYECFVANL